MKLRNATTLVELMVVLTIGSTMLALAAEMVHQGMFLSQSIRNRCQQTLTVNRFLEQFKLDVHMGIAFDEASDESLAIRLYDDSTIAYSADENRVMRQQSWPDGDSNQVVLTLNDRAFGRFDFEKDKSLATLTIYLKFDGVIQSPRIDRHVEAFLGRTLTIYECAEASP